MNLNRDGKSTIVTITDRGPFVKNRTIDLSKAAAQSIGMNTDGVASIIVEPINAAESQK